MLRSLFPHACNDEWTSHLPFSLTRHLTQSDLRAQLWVLSQGPRARASYVRTSLAARLLSRLSRDKARRTLERRYLAAFRAGDIALLNRGASPGLVRELQARGHKVFFECVNTGDATLARIILDAFARAGWPIEPPYDHGPASAPNLLKADFIFTSNPLAAESLLQEGVPASRIVHTSQGWDPARFETTARALPEIDGTTFLFAGSVGVRKGAHLLLAAWSKAGIRGRLVLLGPLERQITKYCAQILGRADVLHRPFDPQPAAIFRSADVFVLPTLEEGGPLVTFEAMGCGLPMVTSPFGAGAVLRHGEEGLVVDPYDEAGLIDALRCMAENTPLRREMGAAGRRRAAEFTWDKVAWRRHELIRQAVA